MTGRTRYYDVNQTWHDLVNFGGIYVFSKAFYPSNDRCKTNRKRYMKLRSRNLATETAVALLCHHSFHSAQFSPMLHPDSQLLTSLNLFFETSTPSTSGGGQGCSARYNGASSAQRGKTPPSLMVRNITQ